jgi:hypothetical protein
MANDLFDEWSTGVSLANNTFFEEIPADVNNPADFSVSRDQIPNNPVNPSDPPPIPENGILEPVIPVPPTDEGPEVIQLDDGGTVTIEKTSKGWKAVLDSGIPGVPQENFYGSTWRQLLANLAKGKLEASKAIKKLKKEKLLGGDDPVQLPTATPQRILTANIPTADDIYSIKNKINENPVEAIDEYFQKRFNLSPEEFAEKLKSADKADKIVLAQTVKTAVDEINREFIRNNPDYVEEYTGQDVAGKNVRLLIARVSKTYLNKKITQRTSDDEVDNAVAELYSKGFWTVENLETAKEELIESGLLERSTKPRSTPTPQPQPVAVTRPSEPPAQRIAANPGQSVAPAGLPARSNTPTPEPETRALTATDLQTMPLDQLRKLAQAQISQSKNQQQ